MVLAGKFRIKFEYEIQTIGISYFFQQYTHRF